MDVTCIWFRAGSAGKFETFTRFTTSHYYCDLLRIIMDFKGLEELVLRPPLYFVIIAATSTSDPGMLQLPSSPQLPLLAPGSTMATNGPFRRVCSGAIYILFQWNMTAHA